MIHLYCDRDVDHYMWRSPVWRSPGEDTPPDSPEWSINRWIHDLFELPGSCYYFQVHDSLSSMHHGYYVVLYNQAHDFELQTRVSRLSPDILQRINSGSLDLLIVYVHEPFDHLPFRDFRPVFYHSLQRIGINRPGSVTVLLGSWFENLCDDHPLLVRWIFYPWFEALTQDQAWRYYDRQLPAITDPMTRVHRFISLGGKNRPHRMMMLRYLEYTRLSRRGLISCDQCAHIDGDEQYWNELANQDPDFNAWLPGAASLDQYRDSQDPNTGTANGWFSTAPLHQQAGWDLVQETLSDGQPGTFITEKTFRALVMGKPALINGGRYTLRVLRDLGYRTWHDIIDESYDEESCPFRRIQKIAKQIKKLCKLSPDQWRTMWPRCLEILQHNQDLAWGRYHAQKFHNLLQGDANGQE